MQTAQAQLNSRDISECLELRVPRLIGPRRLTDARGWFSESYSELLYTSMGIRCRFVQDNHSMSARRGTIRGLHFQGRPWTQAKLVRVVRGSILDAAVDVRRGSPTYGGFVCAELSADNGHQLYVPGGFAHGFCTLSDNTEVLYKVSAHYAPECEGGLRWDDPELGIPWPVSATEAVVSDRDACLPRFRDLRSPFEYDDAPLEPLAVLI